MLVLLTTTVGLVLWIVLWAIDVKAIDGIMLSLALVITAAGTHIAWRFLTGTGGDPDELPPPGA